MSKTIIPASPLDREQQHYRFHLAHTHLLAVFGNDWFARKAESFARFFGTPGFLIGQTVVVAIWIGINVLGVTHFDLYPFILLNLAFSLQAAYAAPLILLAQTRQADRDKVHSEADALHREALAAAMEQRQVAASIQFALMFEMLEQNTRLTALVKDMSTHIEALTLQVHQPILAKRTE